MPLAGRPMLEWSLEAFRASGVAAIIVAVPADVTSSRHPDYGKVGPGDDSITYVAGGATRAQSVANALEVVDTELVAIHDAARPLVTPALIVGVTETLESDPEAAGAIAAAPVTDTIKRAGGRSSASLAPSPVHRHGKGASDVVETLDRGELWAAQTPQVFRAAALREALAADSDPDSATDESMIVERAGGRVLIHPMAAPNLKVTTPFDLQIAEQLLGRSSGE